MNYFFSPSQKFLITWLLILVTGWLSVKTFSYFGELISILLTAALIAFLLNYAVVALKHLLPRTIAAVFVYLGAGVLFVFIVLTLLPLVFDQGRQLLARLPDLIAVGRQELLDFQTWSVEHNLPFDVQFLTSQLLARIQEKAEAITSKGLDIVLVTFNWL